MRRVASHASLGFHRGMLVDKGPACFGVALCADQILVGSRLQIVVPECSMNVVAVAASHSALIHLVVEGHVELRLDVVVAPKAEPGLRGLEQVRRLLALVNAVAADAADPSLSVWRTIEVGVRAGMTAEALGIDFFGCGFGGIEYLGNVAAAVNVSFSRSVAAFARGSVRAVHQHHFCVWIRGKPFGLLGVTRSTGVGTDKA